jgi:hypothetical protein
MVTQKEASAVAFAIFVLVVIGNLSSFIEAETLQVEQNPESLLGMLPDGLLCSKFMICSSTRVNNAIKQIPSSEARATLWGGGLAYSGGSGPLPSNLPSTVFSQHSCNGQGSSRVCLIRNLYYFGELRPQFGVGGGFVYLTKHSPTALDLGALLRCPSNNMVSSIAIRQATVPQVHAVFRSVPKVRAFSHLHVLTAAGTSPTFQITHDARLMIWERKRGAWPFGVRMACEARCTAGDYDASNGNCTVSGGEYVADTYHCHSTDDPGELTAPSEGLHVQLKCCHLTASM